MRMLVRVGAIVGAVGLALVYLLQWSAGLVALIGVIAIGALTGLAAAKWLPRGWYGRQFMAGLRAGIIASGVAGAGALIFLLLQGPHSVAAQEARSHLSGLTLAPQIQQFSALGWTGIDVLGTLVSVGLGIALAAVLAQVFAWTKSRHAVQIIAQARLAAQAFNQSLGRADTWGPVPSGVGRSASTLGGLTGQHSVPGRMTLGPRSGTGTPLPGVNYNSGYGLPSGMTMPAGSPASPYSETYSAPSIPVQATPYSEPYPTSSQPSSAAPSPSWPAESGPWAVVNAADASYSEYMGHTTPPAPALYPPETAQQSVESANMGSDGANASSSGKGRRRRTANPQPTAPQSTGDDTSSNLPPRPPASHASKEAITDAMRNALAAWASSDDDGDEGEQKRDPKASAYLNSDPPKRSRKKQNTRDWLC